MRFILLLTVVAVASTASADDAPVWPVAEYGIFVGTGYDPNSETGLGYGIETEGHGKLVALVEKVVEGAPRKPDFVFLHCLGVYIDKQMELVGWQVARDGGHGLEPHPQIVNTLHLWGEMCDRQGMTAVLYVGGVVNPLTEKYREEEPEKFRAMVDWTLGLTIGSGFDWICADASSKYQPEGPNSKFGPDHEGLAYFTQQARWRGLGVMVEAWPHRDLEPLYAGLPAVMLYNSAFLKQHPLITPHQWGQAPAESHAGVVLFDSRDVKHLTAEEARRVIETGSVIAINWEQWPDYAGSFPPRTPGVRLGGAR